MITVKQFYVNALRECCYILSDESKEAVIIDPGLSSLSEEGRVVKYIEQNELKPAKLLLTHGHFDHVMGCHFITSKYNIPTFIHAFDMPLLKSAAQNSLMFGYTIENPDGELFKLKDGGSVTFGNSALKVVSTPGHTKGSVCFYSEKDKICFTGDTLFAGSCGRVDLPEGEAEQMKNSLLNIIKPLLAPNYQLFAGHGPNSTMKEELLTNPYLKSSAWL